jgi:ABC-type microcin C transport system duplicated ATPase subunit YejF
MQGQGVTEPAFDKAFDPLLAISHLRIKFGTNVAVSKFDLLLARGETLAIVGESGSGKSVAMQACLGLLPVQAKITGHAQFDGIDLLTAPPALLDKIRGRRIAMIFQEPMSSLDPLFPVGAQIAAVLRHKVEIPRREIKARVIALLEQVGIPDPVHRMRAYPHELSGGQRQRVAIAMAIACRPDILIADEPTTALDVTVQAHILDLLADLKAQLNMAMIFISHDLALVRHVADRVEVMRWGEVVESGAAAKVISHPSHEYTRRLVASTLHQREPRPQAEAAALLEAHDIDVRFPLRRMLFAPKREVHAVDHVDLTLRKGETLGLVGESGSGKSTLGRALLKLVPASGRISFEDRELAPLGKAAMRPLRRRMQLIFQDPYGALSPRLPIGEIITEGLRVHEPELSRAERDIRAVEVMEDVRLDPALRFRYPHELSGGQRQRVAIARTMILRPQFVVLDEPTSALDRSIQADIVTLLNRLQDEHALTYLFISHDLSLVRAMADEIAVMQQGCIVEYGKTVDILKHPQQAYTRELITAAFLS